MASEWIRTCIYCYQTNAKALTVELTTIDTKLGTNSSFSATSAVFLVAESSRISKDSKMQDVSLVPRMSLVVFSS